LSALGEAPLQGVSDYLSHRDTLLTGGGC